MGALLSDLTDDLAHQYVANAHDRLAADGPVADARATWAEYVRACHGDVVADVSLPESDVAPDAETLDRVFVRACYYDFLVDSLLDALEGTAGVTLRNRD